MEMFDAKNFQPNAELNSLQTSAPVSKDSEGVKIFAEICSGNDTSKYGKKVDKVVDHIAKLGESAVAGDMKAKAELNSITTYNIEAPLEKRLNIFNFMGDVIKVNYDEEVRFKVYDIEGSKAREQAINGSVPLVNGTWKTRVMETQNISGGLAIDYRQFASKNFDGVNRLSEQVITRMFNIMSKKVEKALYDGIKGATIKNFYEGAGLTKAGVGAVIKNAKRNGTTVNLLGDYNVVSQLADFAGFDVASSTKQFSDAIMDEVNKTGLIHTYKGCNVVELPNALDLGKTVTDANGNTFYGTYLPEGLLYALVAGEMSPLKIGIKSGLRSMSGTDVNLGLDLIRYDMEFGTKFIDEYSHMVGLCSDSTYSSQIGA